MASFSTLSVTNSMDRAVLRELLLSFGKETRQDISGELLPSVENYFFAIECPSLFRSTLENMEYSTTSSSSNLENAEPRIPIRLRSDVLGYITVGNSTKSCTVEVLWQITFLHDLERLDLASEDVGEFFAYQINPPHILQPLA
ncbi:hypothetical protein WAI453_011629 [Rhynchosporium graminicola]